MRIRLLLMLIALTVSVQQAAAQQYYDLTEHYLLNAGFDACYDYDLTRTGNVAQEMQPVNGWTDDYGMDYTIVGVYQVGTPITYNGAAIPSANADGNAEGGVLALSTGWEQELKLYQTVSLPSGKYKLVAKYYNGDASQTAGTSLLGWVPSSGSRVMSSCSSFAVGQWTTDEVVFTLNVRTTGKIQIGFKGAAGGSANSAKVAVDYVRLMRQTDYGAADTPEPTGSLPTVVTDSRFVRGATWAFGRLTVSPNGATISQQGFCYSTTAATPTIADGRSTCRLPNGVYWLKGLQPATKYYMRAYAITTGGRVAYGDVIKCYTVPKGNVTFHYNNGGDAAANARITNALNSACHYFNNMTSTTRHFNVGYSAGTPTADCDYKPQPWINIGAQASYQRTGTFMHEMQHGMGLQNYRTQWCKSDLRSGNGTGYWLGDRVTEALRFWDNNTTSRLNGDDIHMWPYGINGAQEDNLSVQLYLANAMICQALGEDGLEHNETRHADPYYSLPQEDGVKYYLQPEAESCGRYTAYLVADGSTLRLAPMTAAQAASDDRAAWYVTFTPQNQYYQLRNAATGQYMTYSSGIKTAAVSSPGSGQNWHLMRGRVDVDGKRGYWIISPSSNWTPNCLQANSNGVTGQATFNIANSAETQRWLVMTLDEARAGEAYAVLRVKSEFSQTLQQLEALYAVPHAENVEGADNDFLSAISQLEAQVQGSNDLAELLAVASEAQAAAVTFLSSVVPTTERQPFDLTYRLQNPQVDQNADGWSQAATVSYGCAEFYQKTFDFNQTVTNLPAGSFSFGAQAFQRPGAQSTAYSDYSNGSNKVNAQIYAGAFSKNVAHICDHIQPQALGQGSEATLATGKYVPDDMQSASAYFAKGLYENSVGTTVTTTGGSLKVGIRSTSMPAFYWAIFDSFHLYYLGNLTTAGVTVRLADGRYWATFYSSKAAYRLPTGAMAYTASISDSRLLLHELGSVVPKGCAVIIVSDVAGMITLSSTTGSPEAENVADLIATNVLRGTDYDVSSPGTGSGLYVMGTVDGQFGFHRYAAAELSARHAYLQLSGASARSLMLDFADNDAPTSIRPSSLLNPHPSPLYDLQGRGLASPRERGIYVRDGRKMLMP